MITPIPAHRAAAIGMFRWSVFFVMATAAFAQHDEKISTILASIVFLLDVATWHLGQLMIIATGQSANTAWHSTLSNRFIFEKLLDRFRDRQHIDFQEIIREGSQSATADITQYLRDNTFWQDWGNIRKSMLGIAYFVWYWASYAIFYGIAGLVGGFLKSS